VTLRLQNRTVEYQALTPHDALPTGSKVVVTGVLGPDTVEVVPTGHPAEAAATSSEPPTPVIPMWHSPLSAMLRLPFAATQEPFPFWARITRRFPRRLRYTTV
jgi:hypothetical protein